MARRWIGLGSYREFHTIIGDFPAGITHDARFRALVIQDGVRIVDVDQHPPGFARPKRLAEQPAVAPEGQMTHLPSRLAPLLNGVQFVIFPESAIEYSEVAFFDETQPVIANSGKIGGIEKFLFLGSKAQADDGFFRSQRMAQGFADIIGKTSVEGYRFAEEAALLIRRRRRNERHEAIKRQCLPFDRRTGTRQNAK